MSAPSYIETLRRVQALGDQIAAALKMDKAQAESLRESLKMLAKDFLKAGEKTNAAAQQTVNGSGNETDYLSGS